MPTLDGCVNGLFFPGAIPASTGEEPTVISNWTPSLDFSQELNSQNLLEWW